MPNYPRKPRALALKSQDEGLPKLTSKQESFVKGLLQGKRPIEAYREAYSATGMNDKSANTEAWKLRQNPAIAQSLRFFQRIGLEQAKVTQENHLQELARLRELAVENQQISAGVQAEHYRGRAAGLYNDKFTIGVGPTDEALLSQLAALLGPEAAKLMAQALGVEPGETIDLEPSAEAALLAKPGEFA